ncbi:MAG: hypothetical protein ACLT5P_11300 [Flavonifractor plautii]
MAQLLMPGSVVAMTDQAADRLLKLDSGDAARCTRTCCAGARRTACAGRRTGSSGRWTS